MDGESQNQRDVRVEKLWRSLHGKKGDRPGLDLQGLREGLRSINHPLQNADEMLRAVMRTVDTNHDGRIEYLEFRTFVERTEDELWQMFKSIDRDQNGALDKQELRLAFDRANITISDSKLAEFFRQIDKDNDGRITFDEWRDFLLFIPTLSPNLRSVLTYYSSSVALGPEGDASVIDENIQGLGRPQVPPFSIDTYCLILDLRESSLQYPDRILLEPRPQFGYHAQSHKTADISESSTFPWDPGEGGEWNSAAIPVAEDMAEPVQGRPKDTPADEHWLTSLLPHPGYFIAGGIAGIVSRTATAPLDRLKVYLIAQTSVKAETVRQAKSGHAWGALKAAVLPLKEATLELWKMGGIRSLWAGNGLNVVKVAPESAIKFGSYEGAKRVFARMEGHNDPKNLSSAAQFFAAGSGGMISQFAIYPLDTLKFRVQCETVEGGAHGNALIGATFRKVYAEGFLKFYRGLGMGLIGMFPYAAIDLTMYEYMKRSITTRNMKKYGCDEAAAAPGQITTGGIGAVSSSIGATVVYPLNLLRTRLQSQGTAIHPPTYDGWRDCFNRTIQQEGYKGLFKGLTPNLFKVVPAMSISYIVYESSKQFMDLK